MADYGVYNDSPVEKIKAKNIEHGPSGGTLGFFGVTPSSQASAIVSVSTSVALSVCGVYGFTSTQANAIITAVNAVLTALNAKGLIAS
jgi:hypothetical protein